MHNLANDARGPARQLPARLTLIRERGAPKLGLSDEAENLFGGGEPIGAKTLLAPNYW